MADGPLRREQEEARAATAVALRDLRAATNRARVRLPSLTKERSFPAYAPTGMGGLRVVVADDDVLLREGIASLLMGAGYEVVGHAADAATLEGLVRAQRPDLAVVDIRMPPTNTWEGIDAARSIRAEFPEIGILLLSAHVEIDTAIDLLESGERVGYLLKSRVMKAADVVDALERIAEGGSVVDPALVQELVVQRRRPIRSPCSRRASSRCSCSSQRGAPTADRRFALDHRGRGREACAQHPDQAPAAGERRGRAAFSPC
jgi:DNA-binding NarL/FixJ family response regulator